MAEIQVDKGEDGEFQVTITDGGSSTTHRVTVAAETLDEAGATSADELVEASFRFLLDREPKESILSRFDLEVISRYFPEYPSQIRSYL